jgi:phosphoribosylaminoimidazole-succinocarboxamide synthase
VFPSHFVTARSDEILARVPALAGRAGEIAGRAMLVRRTAPVPFECVVRGYLSGSAWAEYRTRGTLAGEPLAAGLLESARLEPPLFSPATKAESGHDENVPLARMAATLGPEIAGALRDASFAVYRAGRDHAAARGIIVADTKLEFGTTAEGTLLLIDELLTPDSSRFWPADRYAPGRSQPSFDKQPLRDYLAGLRSAGAWNGEAPPPPLPAEVVDATSRRYLEAFRLLTGAELGGPARSAPRRRGAGSSPGRGWWSWCSSSPRCARAPGGGSRRRCSGSRWRPGSSHSSATPSASGPGATA